MKEYVGLFGITADAFARRWRFGVLTIWGSDTQAHSLLLVTLFSFFPWAECYRITHLLLQQLLEM
jgi:hypothetical protein